MFSGCTRLEVAVVEVVILAVLLTPSARRSPSLLNYLISKSRGCGMNELNQHCDALRQFLRMCGWCH